MWEGVLDNVVPIDAKAKELRGIAEQAKALRKRAAGLGDAGFLAYMLAMAEDEASSLANGKKPRDPFDEG